MIVAIPANLPRMPPVWNSPENISVLHPNAALTHWPLGDLNKILDKLISVTGGWSISCKSTLVQVMAWCRQATSHYLSQCWPSSLLPYGVSRPQCVSFDDAIWRHKSGSTLAQHQWVMWHLHALISQEILTKSIRNVWKLQFWNYCHISQGPKR